MFQWFRSLFVSPASAPTPDPRQIALERARARRAAAFARHRDAVERKDTRTIHFTRKALTRTTTALLAAERALASSCGEQPTTGAIGSR